VLRYGGKPTIKAPDGVAVSWDATRGDLTLDYTHGALAAVEISGGRRPALTLLLGDDVAGGACWDADGVLACGPALLRHARAKGGCWR
jgi:hypothetical protein